MFHRRTTSQSSGALLRGISQTRASVARVSHVYTVRGSIYKLIERRPGMSASLDREDGADPTVSLLPTTNSSSSSMHRQNSGVTPRSHAGNHKEKQTFMSTPGTPKTPRHAFTVFGMSKLAVAIVSSLMWMCFSGGLIMLNKDLLSNGFPYPMALSGLGMVFSGVASQFVCRKYGFVDPEKLVTREFYLKNIMPVGFLGAMTLWLGNLVYLYLSVSLIQMLKCLTPVITMIALFVSGLETPTQKMVLSVVLIALGTSVASIGAIDASLIGIVIMLGAEIAESVRLVMTQYLLTGKKFHPFEGLMYLAPATALWLGIGSLITEVPSMIRDGAIDVVTRNALKFAAAACMGFGVNLLAYIVIQSASSLTLKVIGTIKNAIVVILGVVLLHDAITITQWIGYGGSIAAFYWYQQIKTQQIKQESG